jgi:hypothetical protein
MVADTDPGGKDNAVAERGTSRDPALADHHAIAADDDVVADLDKVVDLAALADDGVVERPAVDGATCPISTPFWMMTRPACGTFRWPFAPIRYPNPSWPIRHPGWMMTSLPMKAQSTEAFAPM